MEKRSPNDVLKLAKDAGVEIVDVRFCDLPGLMQHFSVPAHELTADVFEDGLGFDGSSIRGFQEIQESDMLLIPDPATALVDPVYEMPTLALICNVMDPVTRELDSRDPRWVAMKAERHLAATGVATTSYWGPEAEFYVFDQVRYDSREQEAYYHIDSEEGIWNSGREGLKPNLGHRPRFKQGYFPCPPTDTFQDFRSRAVMALGAAGIPVEAHHHEVGTAGQGEIDLRYAPLTRQGDQMQLYKFIVKNLAQKEGKTATFMPKPIFEDNGSGMHVHQSLWSDERPLFFDEAGYGHLSPLALSYIAGQARLEDNFWYRQGVNLCLASGVAGA